LIQECTDLKISDTVMTSQERNKFRARRSKRLQSLKHSFNKVSVSHAHFSTLAKEKHMLLILNFSTLTFITNARTTMSFARLHSQMVCTQSEPAEIPQHMFVHPVRSLWYPPLHPFESGWHHTLEPFKELNLDSKRVESLTSTSTSTVPSLTLSIINYAAKLVQTRHALSSTISYSHQETVSGQPATLPILIALIFFFWWKSYGTRYQSGSFFLFYVGSAFHCLRLPSCCLCTAADEKLRAER